MTERERAEKEIGRRMRDREVISVRENKRKEIGSERERGDERKI